MEMKSTLTSYDEENIESTKYAAFSGFIVGLSACCALSFLMIYTLFW
ncbi:MAG: hypothetical protein AB8G05_20760 [Oligoflexales bacterium]